MAQADQTIQNDTFPTVRADINNNLAALFSNNSGATAPSVTVAHMDWIDTSGANPVWKKRNAANNAWITVGTISGNSITLQGALPSQSGQSGKYLTTDGSNASWGTVAATGQLLRAPQILTSGTTYTTPAGCNAIYVEAVGGGGGGQAGAGNTGGAGGGAGAYCARYFSVTPSTSYSYAIGAGGTGGVSGTSGSAGGNTTFTVGAVTITAGGGGGGAGSGGAGGTGTNGTINAPGGGGGAGSSAQVACGVGGNSFFGGGAPSRYSAGLSGSNGGGGSGGYGTLGSGGAGGAGLIRIWEYS